jgi:hypothetical protein
VILDHNLAKLYPVEIKVLKQVIRRKLTFFPDDFMFQVKKKDLKKYVKIK